MIDIERNIKHFHLRGSVHLGLFYIYFGCHRNEGWFVDTSRAHWLNTLLIRIKGIAK